MLLLLLDLVQEHPYENLTFAFRAKWLARAVPQEPAPITDTHLIDPEAFIIGQCVYSPFGDFPNCRVPRDHM